MAERVVVVGAGGISNAWFPPLLEEKVDVVAVVDMRKEAAEAQIAKYGLQSEASADLKGTLKRLKPDFVLDLTIPEAHSTVTCTALRAGCHVIGEKPMAASMTEARRMVRTAEETGQLYMVSQSRRWDNKHDRIHRTVAAGAFGDLTTINCDFYLGAHFGGFRDEMPSPLILDMSIHHFDMARLMGGVDPVAVYAHEFNPKGSWYQGDVAASCIFEMSNGVVFTYRGSWCAEGCHTSWNGNWRLIGDKGTLLYENDADPHGEVVTGDDGFTRPKAPLTVEESSLTKSTMHGGLCEMLDFLRTGKMPQTECHDNIKSLAMVFAAMESAKKAGGCRYAYNERLAACFKDTIRIGTLVNGGAGTANYLRQILPHGFESFSITFWQTLGDTDLAKLAKEVNAVLADSNAVISSLGVFGNPLMEDETAAQTRDGWKRAIDAAHLFNCDIVAGFAGRVVDRPIDESMPRFAEVFTPLAQQAADNGVRIAFENCEMGGDWSRGDWNIAQTPIAWEMMFDAVPFENIGLQWEPCHQMVKLIDPMPQLRKWVKKIFHVHGKDATIYWDVIREHGVRGPKQFAYHRTPGFGDSNWTDIISELRLGGFTGSIDIEGWHDPVYRGDLEMMGQVHGLNYLKQCRGGSFVPNPS